MCLSSEWLGLRDPDSCFGNGAVHAQCRHFCPCTERCICLLAQCGGTSCCPKMCCSKSYLYLYAISKKFPFSEVLPPQIPQCSRTTAWARLQGRWFHLVKAGELSKSQMSSACCRNVGVSLEIEKKKKKGVFNVHQGVLAVIHKVSRCYHPIKSFYDGFTEHMGLLWGQEQPWLCYQLAAKMDILHSPSFSEKQKCNRMPCMAGHKEGKTFCMGYICIVLHFQCYKLQIHELCGVYTTFITPLYYFASISLWKSNTDTEDWWEFYFSKLSTRH